MACYLGCQTKRNKILWGVLAVLVLVAAIFIAVGLSRLPVCRRNLPSDCQTSASLSKTRNTQISPECAQKFANCFRPWLILAGIGAVALACALVCTCVMCCCNKTPKHAQDYHTNGVQMIAQPVHPNNPYASYEQQQQQPYAAGAPYGSHYTQQPNHTAAAAGPYGHQQQQQQQYQQHGTPYPPAAAPAGPYAGTYQAQGYQQQQQQQYGAPAGYPAHTHGSSVPVHQV